MKLSMWILLKELREFSPIPVIESGEPILDEVQIFSYETSFSKNYVYIGRASDFYGKSNINQIFLVNGHDFIFINNVEMEYILNCVICIFSKYRAFDTRITSASRADNPFQEIIDISHELFQCPMFFGRKDLHIYAITRGYKDSDLFPEWEYIVATRTMSQRYLEWVQSKDLAVKYPEEDSVQTVMPSVCRTYTHTIRNCCYLDGVKWGHLYLFYKLGEPDPGTLQLVQYVADKLIECVSLQKDAHMKYLHRYPSLTALLSGSMVSDAHIAALMNINGWSDDEPLILCLVRNEDLSYNSNVLSWISGSLEITLPNSLVLTYQSSAVAIVSLRNSSEDQTCMRMLSICQGQHFTIGFSYPFQDLRSVAAHYRQASFAWDCAQKAGASFSFYAEEAFEGMIDEISRQIHITDWITPKLLALRENDEKQHSSYFRTLYCYLTENCHLANTSKRLYIHRNTLIYRLSRIEEILEIDLHNSDHRTFLLFCFYLLGERSPAPLPADAEPPEES